MCVRERERERERENVVVIIRFMVIHPLGFNLSQVWTRGYEKRNNTYIKTFLDHLQLSYSENMHKQVINSYKACRVGIYIVFLIMRKYNFFIYLSW